MTVSIKSYPREDCFTQSTPNSTATQFSTGWSALALTLPKPNAGSPPKTYAATLGCNMHWEVQTKVSIRATFFHHSTTQIFPLSNAWASPLFF